jgi:hypothetical protein
MRVQGGYGLNVIKGNELKRIRTVNIGSNGIMEKSA